MTIPNPLSPINPRSATRVGGALKPFSGQVILAVKPRRLLRARAPKALPRTKRPFSS